MKVLGITRVKEPRSGYEPDQPPFSLPLGKHGMHDADEEQYSSREQKEDIHGLSGFGADLPPALG